jgi:hypothetical protein
MNINDIRLETVGHVVTAWDQKAINREEALSRLTAAGVSESAAEGILTDCKEMPDYGLTFMRGFFGALGTQG